MDDIDARSWATRGGSAGHQRPISAMAKRLSQLSAGSLSRPSVQARGAASYSTSTRSEGPSSPQTFARAAIGRPSFDRGTRR